MEAQKVTANIAANECEFALKVISMGPALSNNGSYLLSWQTWFFYKTFPPASVGSRIQSQSTAALVTCMLSGACDSWYFGEGKAL